MLPGKTFTAADALQVIGRRIWILLLPLAVISAATAVIARLLPDKYKSETLILVVPQQVPESYVRSTVTTRIEDRLQSIAQQILSRTRLERIIQDFDLYQNERRTGMMEDVVEGMRKDINIQVVKGDAFRVTYSGTEPRTVMRVTERLASLFIEENLHDREVLADGTNQFLEAQLEDARRRLIEQERKLEEYRRQHSGELPSQLESNMQAIQNAQLQIQSSVESQNRDRDRQLLLHRQIADLEQQTPTDNSTIQLTDLDGDIPGATPAQQLAAARAGLAALQRRYKPEHPDVVRMQRVIAELEAKFGADADDPEKRITPAEAARRGRLKDLQADLDQVNRQIALKESEEQRLRGVIAAYQKRVDSVPTRESELTELTRDYTTLRDMYGSLLAKKEESGIAANLERRQIGEQFKLLDPARLAEKPYSPNRVAISLAGMAGGLAAGLMLIAFLEYRDASFSSDDEISSVLSLPVLATVPFMQSQDEQRRARRRRIALNVGCTASVVACVAVVVYTLVR
jgi:polysaccharide chain length determinant protein (PEP-CTERM system associated)